MPEGMYLFSSHLLAQRSSCLWLVKDEAEKQKIRGLEIHEIVLDQVIDLRITEAKTVQGQGMKQEVVGA